MRPHDFILILDFGSQYTQLIARRLRELGVYSEIKTALTPLAEVHGLHPRGIVFSGGPNSVYDQDAPSVDPEIFNLGVPILGLCYGQQLLAHLLGGKVQPSPHREYGLAELNVLRADALFENVDKQTRVWMSHGDAIVAAPPDFVTIGATNNAPHAAFVDHRRKLYGLQFHPEVTHTIAGRQILQNFLFHVCGCKA
ncbi:MAG: glutamine-hydrolyzing GMP synthase, partial [candidate division KSB1 bacterium]